MKASIDIQSYKANFLGGARQYLFWTQINFPSWGNVLQAGLQKGLAQNESIQGLMEGGKAAANAGATGAISSLSDTAFLNKGQKKWPYLVRSTNLPSSDVEEIVTSWVGQTYKMGARRIVEDWTVTFVVDNDGAILKRFWDWQNIIHNPEANIYGKPVSYMADQEIHLLGYDTGETICVYKLYGAWPKNIGQVQLDYSTNDIAQFDVTFSYQYHVVTEKEQGMLASFLAGAGRSVLAGSMGAITGELGNLTLGISKGPTSGPTNADGFVNKGNVQWE